MRVDEAREHCPGMYDFAPRRQTFDLFIDADDPIAPDADASRSGPLLIHRVDHISRDPEIKFHQRASS
ncbi:MAG: hypothetical protein ACTIC1_00045 [Brevibacterium sp.]